MAAMRSMWIILGLTVLLVALSVGSIANFLGTYGGLLLEILAAVGGLGAMVAASLVVNNPSVQSFKLPPGLVIFLQFSPLVIIIIAAIGALSYCATHTPAGGHL